MRIEQAALAKQSNADANRIPIETHRLASRSALSVALAPQRLPENVIQRRATQTGSIRCRLCRGHVLLLLRSRCSLIRSRTVDLDTTTPTSCAADEPTCTGVPAGVRAVSNANCPRAAAVIFSAYEHQRTTAPRPPPPQEIKNRTRFPPAPLSFRSPPPQPHLRVAAVKVQRSQ